MSNSFIANGMNKFFFVCREIFENSTLFKIFSAKNKKSDSQIVRKLMDEEAIEKTNCYHDLKKLEPQKKEPTIDSKILNAIFCSKNLNISIVILVLSILVLVFPIKNLKYAGICAILFALFGFFNIILKHKYYEHSFFVKFIKYVYAEERKDESR